VYCGHRLKCVVYCGHMLKCVVYCIPRLKCVVYCGPRLKCVVYCGPRLKCVVYCGLRLKCVVYCGPRLKCVVYCGPRLKCVVYCGLGLNCDVYGIEVFFSLEKSCQCHSLWVESHCNWWQPSLRTETKYSCCRINGSLETPAIVISSGVAGNWQTKSCCWWLHEAQIHRLPRGTDTDLWMRRHFVTAGAVLCRVTALDFITSLSLRAYATGTPTCMDIK
jgi:hypothetical protein